MTHVVTANCQKCRFTECVATCPVDCFHVDVEMLYINPATCIDCAACPVQAIYFEHDMPVDKTFWLEINAERAKTLPVIDTMEQPLPTAEAKRESLGLD